MSTDKKQSFMKGALILMIANILVKIIGAVFKIPLNHLLGDEGMGYFGIAYTVYNWLFIIATAGIPVAISKMVAESRAKGNNGQIQRIFKVSFCVLTFIGVAGFMFLYFGADFCADKMASPAAATGIRALAPAIFFVALMSVFRGYFQGHQDMVPTAVSEVCEAVGKLVIGYGTAYLLISRGVQQASAGAVFGVSAGGFFALISLAVIYFVKNKRSAGMHITDSKASKSVGEIVSELIKISIPITVGASVFSLTSIIDASMIMRRLQSAAGFDYEHANLLWGAYSGKTITMFNLVPTLITAISISIVPTIASAFALKDTLKARKATEGSLKITVLLTLPCSVGMAILAGPIVQLVFKSVSAQATLSILGYGIIFVSLVSLTNAILQSTGHTVLPVIHMVIGGVVKIIVNYFLVGNPDINIKGAPIGTIICYAVILLLNLISIKRIMDIRYKISSLVLKPAISVIAMAAAVLAVYNFVSPISGSLATLVSIGAGGVVYLAVLFVSGGVTSEDVAMIPKGEKLVPVLKKFRLIKE